MKIGTPDNSFDLNAVIQALEGHCAVIISESQDNMGNMTMTTEKNSTLGTSKGTSSMNASVLAPLRARTARPPVAASNSNHNFPTCDYNN